MATPIPLLTPAIYDGIEDKGLKTDITGWNSHHPIFQRILERMKPKTIIEDGTWKGASVIHMASLCDAPRLFAVDHFLGGCDHVFHETADKHGVQRDRHGWPGVYYQFLHNVKAAGYAERIIPVPMVSVDGAALLLAHGIRAEVIYIDACHDYAQCRLDIRAFRPLLAPGGVMFGDDYQRASVHDAVHEELKSRAEPDETGVFWWAYFP